MTQQQLEDILSPAQMQVYNLCCQGKTPEQITGKLDMTLGVVNAQITRIKSKGVSFPGEAGYEARDDKGRVLGPVRPLSGSAPEATPVHHGPFPQEPRVSPTSNEAIQRELENSGKALSASEFAALSEKVAGSTAKDIHPMALLGCTIQYVRMCGGRYTAHQLIEDVYGALREFVGSTEPDKGGVATPFPMSPEDRIAYLEEQNRLLREENTKFKGGR